MRQRQDGSFKLTKATDIPNLGPLMQQTARPRHQAGSATRSQAATAVPEAGAGSAAGSRPVEAHALKLLLVAIGIIGTPNRF
jgi:hypothetical protein